MPDYPSVSLNSAAVASMEAAHENLPSQIVDRLCLWARLHPVIRELLMFGLIVPAAADPWPDPRGWLSDSTMAIALHRAMRRMELTLAPPEAVAFQTYGALCC